MAAIRIAPDVELRGEANASVETKTPTAVRVTEHPARHLSAGNMKYVDVSNIQFDSTISNCTTIICNVTEVRYPLQLKTISEVWGKNVGC